MKSNKRLYSILIDILEKKPMTRRELIESYITSLSLPRELMLDKSTGGRVNIERSIAGAAINEMKSKGIITKSPEGVYFATEQKPVVIRNEKCESEIFKMLADRSLTKFEIRKNLTRIFGTDKTLTEKDDNKLFAYMGEALRRMVKDGALTEVRGVYSLSKKVSARADDISNLLTLKSVFLTHLHRKGGEFFENYFMTLLEKYVTLHGKTVTSNTTTGGSADGGIDGILETVDVLGFRETIMVQTKNRTDTTNETTVRGFYGAVCARQGSRGIFVTSSDFHYSAKAFLDSIDNCVGIDGDGIFKMAVETRYGIKKVGSELTVDEKIL
ncbi:MAG: restriction endonuclease [Ruminococcaceae bacterium]|nr:restriction endonuclease [Oscillospiraceae bacterium]